MEVGRSPRQFSRHAMGRYLRHFGNQQSFKQFDANIALEGVLKRGRVLKRVAP